MSRAILPMPETFEKTSVLPAPIQEAFAWHERPGALDRLNPPWNPVQVLSHSGGILDGGRVELQVALGPIRSRWTAEHYDYQPPNQFCDRQRGGPFASFEHRHLFTEVAADQCQLRDQIEFVLPGGFLGRTVGLAAIRSELNRVFAYRHNITAQDLKAHRQADAIGPLRVAITGASGLVGRSLVPFLTTGGHQVTRLVRSSSTTAATGELAWNPQTGAIDAQGLEGHDAVVHLSGENIAKSRWTDEVKRKIRSSRVDSTRLLCETLAALKQPPKVLVCASAIGFYGHREDELLDETSTAGTGFLPEVCAAWEQACEPARRAGIRVVNLRLGVVVAAQSGPLPSMRWPTLLGLNGPVGTGRQWLSWVALDDVVGIAHRAIYDTSFSGPVNCVASAPVTNAEFVKTLAGVLSRPAIIPIPSFAIRFAMGEMADALLLHSTRVVPNKLLENGYSYRFSTLEGAIRQQLGRLSPS